MTFKESGDCMYNISLTGTTKIRQDSFLNFIFAIGSAILMLIKILIQQCA